MKGGAISYLSLAVSLAALSYAAWIHTRVDKMAIESVHKREGEFVTTFTPKMIQIYSTMSTTTNFFPSPPETLEELFSPLVDTINRLAGNVESVGRAQDHR
jgi:hypothetical protein